MKYTLLATMHGYHGTITVARYVDFDTLPDFVQSRIERHGKPFSQLTFMSGGYGFTVIVGDRYGDYVYNEEGVGQWERSLVIQNASPTFIT